MHPMKLITYVLFFSVAMLIAMGGIGFYAGYSAGRGDLDEMKAFVATSGSPENAAAMAEVLKQAGKNPASAEVNLAPVMEEIRAMSAQIAKLEQTAASASHAPAPAPVSGADPRLKEELAAIKQRLSSATEQYNTCKQDLSLMQVKLETQSTAPQATAAPAPVAMTPPEAPRSGGANANAGGSVILYDNALLKRDQNKLYSDVDVALSLQSVTSKSAKVIVNQQAVAIAFGERKIFQHRDVTCELQLRETDLETSQAKVSIACKR